MIAYTHIQGISVLMNKNEFVLISKASKILGVSIDTVRRWDKNGTIHSQRIDGKNRYFSVEALSKIRREKPFTITEAARKLNISTSTLRRLEKNNLLNIK